MSKSPVYLLVLSNVIPSFNQFFGSISSSSFLFLCWLFEPNLFGFMINLFGFMIIDIRNRSRFVYKWSLIFLTSLSLALSGYIFFLILLIFFSIILLFFFFI